MLDLSKITDDVYKDISEYLQDDVDISEIPNMTAKEALDAYLMHNGIIGYTSKIIDVWEMLLAAQEATVTPMTVKILWGRDHDPGDTPKEYHFTTHAECSAFLEGVEEASGWLYHEII